nr:hypothetical protein GCM10020093_036440 [Planobispora longispora]
MCEAAVRAARAIGYIGAGTVEFLVKDDTVAFLEMNTRLQVEHPVTECVHRVDLVELQLRIAEGEPLPPAPRSRGSRHRGAPVRRGSRPRLAPAERRPAPLRRPRRGRPLLPVTHGLRLDSGVEDGSEIGVHYDPMLAKVVAHGVNRADAARRLAAALARARVHGPVTNRDLLVAVLRHPSFLAGETHTGFLDEHAPAASSGEYGLSALAAALAEAAANRAAATVQAGLPSGWRNVPSQPQRVSFQVDGGTGADVCAVAYRLTRDGLRADGFPGTVLVGATPGTVVLETSGVRRRFSVARHDGVTYVDSPLGAVRLTPLPRLPEPVETLAPGSLLAPMPGTVLRVEVKSGEPVAAGQVVVVLEAMKMEHRIIAPAGGTVAELNATPGRQVEAGAVLAVIEEEQA